MTVLFQINGAKPKSRESLGLKERNYHDNLNASFHVVQKRHSRTAIHSTNRVSKKLIRHTTKDSHRMFHKLDSCQLTLLEDIKPRALESDGFQYR